MDSACVLVILAALSSTLAFILTQLKKASSGKLVDV